MWTTSQQSKLTKNPEFHATTSISPYVHRFIRELVQEGDVNSKWIGTSGNIADVLTKALLRSAFQRLVDMMGSVGAEEPEDGASGVLLKQRERVMSRTHGVCCYLEGVIPAITLQYPEYAWTLHRREAWIICGWNIFHLPATVLNIKLKNKVFKK